MGEEEREFLISAHARLNTGCPCTPRAACALLLELPPPPRRMRRIRTPTRLLLEISDIKCNLLELTSLTVINGKKKRCGKKMIVSMMHNRSTLYMHNEQLKYSANPYF
jgi:hypothetical protein